MSIVSRITCNGIDILDTKDPDIRMTEAKYSASFADRIADIKIDMTILPTHPYYNYIKERVFPEHPQQRPIRERTSTFLAWDNDREIFHGRPISADCDIYHRLKVTCECDAKFLEDVPDIFSMAGLDDKTEKIKFGVAVSKIFTSYDSDDSENYGYNRHAGDARKIYLGGLDPSLAEKEIDKPSSNSIYSNLKSWLEAVEGYAKVIPVEDHYELFISESRGAVDPNFFVKYGENVTDYKIQRGSENFYTAIHAVGKDGDSFIVPDGTETLDSDFMFWHPDKGSSGVIAGKVIRHIDGAQTYGEIIYVYDGAKWNETPFSSTDQKGSSYEGCGSVFDSVVFSWSDKVFTGNMRYLSFYGCKFTHCITVFHCAGVSANKLAAWFGKFDFTDCDFRYKARLTAVVMKWCETVEKAGYFTGFYTMKSWCNVYLDMAKLSRYTFWLAHYTNKTTYTGSYAIWQYSSSGKVDGISGNVDMNYCYADFPAQIKKLGLNGYKKEADKRYRIEVYGATAKTMPIAVKALKDAGFTAKVTEI